MNHTDPVQIPGASPEASVIIKQVLASMIAGVTTQVMQTDDVQNINVNVIAMDTGLKFTFVLPSATAISATLIADLAMSDVSQNPVQNKVIKAYVDNKFWTGTAAEYALLEDDTDLLCFLSDTNIIMYNGESYSLSAHAHGNLTNEGAIGVLAGLVVVTGADGVLETITIDDLKELLGASSGMNLLHNGEFASPFNTAGLTIYSTTGECLDRWNLLGGTLTINAGHATLSQAAINTAQLRQMLPVGSYQRLMGQTLSLSVLLDDNQTVFEGSGVIDGAASTIMTLAIANGYTARLIVDNGAKTAYVEINGGASVAAIDMLRVKLEIGATSSIEDGVTDAALDWARLKLYTLAGAAREEGAYVRYDAVMTLNAMQKTQVRTNIDATATGLGVISYSAAQATLTDAEKAQARTNAGASSKPVDIAVSVLAASWAAGLYTISNAAITADNAVIFTPAAAATDAELGAIQAANIQRWSQSAGQIVVKARGTVPTINVPLAMTIWG